MTNNAVARFVGGSPMAVLLRLIVVSFVVGLLLEAFGLDPVSLLRGCCARRGISSNTG